MRSNHRVDALERRNPNPDKCRLLRPPTEIRQSTVCSRGSPERAGRQVLTRQNRVMKIAAARLDREPPGPWQDGNFAAPP
jgi:hypothetical protein